MKKIVYILLLCLPMLSCQDASSLMDKEDVGDLYEKDVFRSGTYARYFVNDIYYNIISTGYGVSGWGGAYMDCATDNGEARPLNSAAHRYNTGNWNAADNPLGFIWTNSYAQIRACNKFLENYHLIEEESGITTRLDIEYLHAQVIFLRAYFYSELLRAFGGVPLITKVLSMNDPEINSERDSFETVLDFIVSECENAAELLKSLRGEDATRYGMFGGNFGRANEGTALALKAKVLLMAASPLFNRPANFPQYDSADPNVSLWRYPDYDPERWNTAAKALKDVIDLGFYDLYRAKNGTKTEYETLFCVRAPIEEAIFPYLRGPSIDIYFNNLPFDFMLVRGKGTPVCYTLPTHDLVMAYEMKNGMLPEQEGSGYRPLNPFADRDPRLNATIWHDESVFCNIRFDTWHREVTSEKSDGKHYITGYSRTGYFLRKYMDPDLNPSASTAPTLPNSYHLIRYADILLMYAEALNEYHADPASAPEDGIRWAIDQVRSRAGMPGVDETFRNRGWDLTQENVRKFIQNERRVEFAFEEQRFWDIRRWMIGTQTQREAHELDITLKDDDLTKVYKSRKFENRIYEDHMNLMPIPQSEINKNPNLVQNWGWSPKQVN